MNLEDTRKDIQTRNAGEECITVWKDGTWVHCGIRDAELYKLSEPDDVILVVKLTSVEAATFMPLQDRVHLYEKLFGKGSKK